MNVIPKNSHPLVGLSLWLIPDENTTGLLKSAIRSLALRFDSPLFMPHATLLGQIQGTESSIIETAEGLAEETHTIQIKGNGLDGKADYYRALYLRLPLNEDLDALRLKACIRFSIQPLPAYNPHLSLIYADLRRETRQELVQLNQTLAGIELTLERLQVVRTTGPVVNWVTLADFQL